MSRSDRSEELGKESVERCTKALDEGPDGRIGIVILAEPLGPTDGPHYLGVHCARLFPEITKEEAIHFLKAAIEMLEITEEPKNASQAH